MAKRLGMGVGDRAILRWRDAKGTFDAAEARIVELMKTNVPAIDSGVLWIPLDRMRRMMRLPGEATLVVTTPDSGPSVKPQGWTFHDPEDLLQEITDRIRMKTVGSFVVYIILLTMALLAIFDTQVLSVFRRTREIGTLMALGMTRGEIIRLFTMEGALSGLMAAALAALYGTPLLIWAARHGYTMPRAVDSYGLPIAPTLYPVFGVPLVLVTVIVIMSAVTFISCLPARKISDLAPTDAIRGRIG